MLSLGVDFAEALVAAEALEPVVGRLQAVGDGADIRVIVDYAHTPDALERAIRALKETDNAGALWVLFGCGGDRDSGKRAEMGAIACQFADRVIVTSDNPRSEAPERSSTIFYVAVMTPDRRVRPSCRDCAGDCRGRGG